MKGMKKVISVVLTVLTTVALASTVYAANYSSVFPSLTTSAPETSVSSATVADAIKALVADGKISGDATIEVKSIASLPISSSVIKALQASKDGVLTIVSPKVTFAIDAKSIAKVRKVDLSGKIYNTANRSVVDLRAKKDFGCTVKITITSCQMSKAQLASAHLYRNGDDLGDDKIEIDENGNPVISVTKAGKYEIKAAK